ncbi:hypothetical protein ETU10_01325 [Apibacter muscae]|uniref:hypothetical protein n=1 Tax=Apibacter muscae TaxID=2509004 RepID=UPI0011ADCA39|nr:hypothetical protein [Apibacter muscae]TWP24630.1 hypothetical protein ETU10_01325 [Apibacter muscae]
MNDKKYKILNSLPAYGLMYHFISKKGKPFYYEGFPVRLYKSDGDSWVANFELGQTEFSEVFELEMSRLLIISGGECFIMNPDDIMPIEVFGGDYLNYLKTNDGRIILYNHINLTIVDSKGNYWDSERISLDGLNEIKISSDNVVSGLFYQPTPTDDLWIPFEYNIDTKSLIYDEYMLTSSYKDSKKSWWKYKLFEK